MQKIIKQSLSYAGFLFWLMAIYNYYVSLSLGKPMKIEVFFFLFLWILSWGFAGIIDVIDKKKIEKVVDKK